MSFMQNRKTLDDMQSLDSTRSSVLVAVVVGVLFFFFEAAEAMNCYYA